MDDFELAVVGMTAKQIYDLLCEIAAHEVEVMTAGGLLSSRMRRFAHILRTEINRRHAAL